MHSSYILYKTPTQQRLMPYTVWRMHSTECGIRVFSVSSHSWTGNMTLYNSNVSQMWLNTDIMICCNCQLGAVWGTAVWKTLSMVHLNHCLFHNMCLMNAGKETYGYDSEKKMAHWGPEIQRKEMQLQIKTTIQQKRLEIFHQMNWSNTNRHLTNGSQLMYGYSSHETLQARFLDSNKSFDSGHTQRHT
jgi:hypothetical protein